MKRLYHEKDWKRLEIRDKRSLLCVYIELKCTVEKKSFIFDSLIGDELF